MGRAASPPAVVERSSAEAIAEALGARLARDGFAEAGSDPLLNALVRIAARYGEIVADALNAAPALHLAAFAARLPATARPASAAEGFVTLRPTPGGSGPLRLPSHTRLAAGGAAAPFETLSDLDLVRAEAVEAIFVDAGHGRMTNLRALVAPDGGVDAAPSPIGYALHLSQTSILNMPGLTRISLQVEFAGEPSSQGPSGYAWLAQSPAGELPLTVLEDGTRGLTRSGEVSLAPPPGDWSAVTLDGLEARWLTLRRLDDGSAAPRPPPRLARLLVSGEARIPKTPIAAACTDGAPADVTRDVFPFGERPRFGAVWQLLSAVFGEAGARVDLHIEMTNPAAAAASPIPSVTREDSPQVIWEISVAGGFRPVEALDGTLGLTRSGIVSFLSPADVAPVAIGGQRGVWLRARLAGGGFGEIIVSQTPRITTPRAPAVKSVHVAATISRSLRPPDVLVSEGALTTRRLAPSPSAPEDLFPTADVAGAALYLGLDGLAGGSPFQALAADVRLSWYVRPPATTGAVVLADPASPPRPPRVQLRGPDGWRDLSAQDGTEGFARPGVLTATLSHAPAPWVGCLLDAARPRAWLRLVWPGPATRADMPSRLALNSVAVRQSEQLRGEVLGSSNGRPGQRFAALRTPIVGEVDLEVREDGAWTPWIEHDGFADLPPGARAFVLDRTGGDIRFGDGRRGRVPPAGSGNIRLAAYATGGGEVGNQPAGAISQLRSAPPGIEGVTNLDPTHGGLDVETSEEIRRRASAWLMHRDRAVCAEDYAALAQAASAEVARAYCAPERDLSRGDGEPSEPGVVSLVIVPRSPDAMPQPRPDLLETVRAFLDDRRPAAARLVLTGPRYARADVEVALAAKRGWSPSEVGEAAARSLAAYLHPLTGGDGGEGWAPGARPHVSDLYGLLDGVDGLERAERLSLSVDAPPGSLALVAAGEIRVRTI